MDKRKVKNEINDELLEKASGGYGIIHRHDGYKTLIDDRGNRVNKKFMDTHKANDYAKTHKGFGNGLEWQEY